MGDYFEQKLAARRRMEAALGEMSSDDAHEFFTALEEYIRYSISEHTESYEHKNRSPW